MTEDHWSNNPRFRKTSMTSEDEEFNRIEREASLRKAAVRETVSKRQWIGLTDDEKQELVSDEIGRIRDYEDYADAIEAKLKEKNT
jgi:hypothetical protein